MTGKDSGIKVLDKMYAIIDTIRDHAKHSGAPGVNEIAKLTGIHPATVHRILKSLQSNGWVIQDRRGKYILGTRFLSFVDSDDTMPALREAAYFVMRELTESESQAMNLAIRRHEKVIIFEQTRTGKLLDYVLPAGAELTPHATACGKVLLSELPDPLLNDILSLIELKPLTSRTIVKRNVLLKELELVRSRGYAIDIHESLDQSCCVAVPVRDENRRIIAALSFSGILGTLEESDIRYYASVLFEGSRRITEKLYEYKRHAVR